MSRMKVVVRKRPLRVSGDTDLVYVRSLNTMTMYPPPPCTSYANVHNYYGPCAHRSLDKGVACTQHIQLPTHTCAGHMC